TRWPRDWSSDVCSSDLFGMMVQMGATNTLLQVMVPDRLRGRVMSLYSMMFIGMGPIGALLGGAVAARIGAPWTVAIGGVTCLAEIGRAACREGVSGSRR